MESGATFPADNEPSIPGRVAKLSADMLQFAEEPKAVVILDENRATTDSRRQRTSFLRSKLDAQV